MVDRFARDEQPHDLRRALEDQIDARSRASRARSESAARRARAASPRSRSRGRRGSAARRRRCATRARCCTSSRSPPRAGCRSSPCSASADGELGDRLHRERVRRHHRDLLRDRLVLADRLRPTARARSPTSRDDLQQRLAAAGAARGKREAPGVERDQRELESLPFAPENVLARDAHVREADDAVLDRLESHEAAAMHDLDAGPSSLRR